MTHTPGPWFLDLRGGDDYDNEGHFCISGIEQNQRRPILLCNVGYLPSKRKATPAEKFEREQILSQGLINGRLIAAAPSMLDALREIETVATDPAKAIARIAIAKAEGKR